MTIDIRVDLGEHTYDIHIGNRLLDDLGPLLRPHLQTGKPVTVVTDANVDRHQMPAISAGLDRAGVPAQIIIVEPGEASKSFAKLESILAEMLRLKVERKDLIIAAGGGVIGDLTGFAASILRRGVRFVQIPTTLLAQVDSSVGGKTGINTSFGKNLVGSFHQPQTVIIDVQTLASLPDRELRAGYAEIVKYALLGDRGFFDWLERHGSDVIGRDQAACAHAIAESCRAKAAIVAEDEREQGRRALLNLGHTFGHALEAEGGYDGRLLHGEAVAVGMIMAMELSTQLGLTAGQDVERVRRHFRHMGLPTAVSDTPLQKLTADRMIEHMNQDKKVEDGRLTLILLRGLGEAFIAQDFDVAAMRQMLENHLSPSGLGVA